ncbi:MAG: dTDP-4-dehydrorhamnose reductase [Desulfobacterales bacterium]|jgi:dTDP-4-dehydrorhamnose reductase
MKILIFGGKGQLGYELVQQGLALGHAVKAPLETQTNIVDIDEVKRTIDTHQPSLVINSAAYTAVDKAETEKKIAFAVNKTGAANLARCCAPAQIPLIQISTDYVFDGQKGAPYLETDPISPIGIYGRSKADGEAEIRSHLYKHIIIRTSWLYGVHGHNFVKTMLKLVREKELIQVVADQHGSPTSALDLAEAVLIICGQIENRRAINWGTFHYCGQGITTWHEFAEKILELSRLKDNVKTARIEPLSTAEYPTAATRPQFSALDCNRITHSFGIKPKPWRESLKRVIEIIYSPSDEAKNP